MIIIGLDYQSFLSCDQLVKEWQAGILTTILTDVVQLSDFKSNFPNPRLHNKSCTYKRKNKSPKWVSEKSRLFYVLLLSTLL
jgi:hypothetical protein